MINIASIDGIFVNPPRNLFVRGEQGRADSSDAADGGKADQGPHLRHRDRAGRFNPT